MRGAGGPHRQRIERRWLADAERGSGPRLALDLQPVYPASKTALNAMTLAMAIELAPEGIKVNVVSPGFTKTNLNNYVGTQTAEEGAREVVRVALLGANGSTGTFSNEDGPLPWWYVHVERPSLWRLDKPSQRS
jgi:NAD(P)-dependent dehydrogenase (short-subunit alcohol dehydrogenase family)